MPSAIALPDDSAQPIQIQADRAELDQRKGTAVYTGAVHLTQGSLEVTSDRLVITSKNNEVIRIDAEGQGTPAHYSQRAKPDQPPLLANARTITYLTKEKRIKLLGNAHLTQGKNTFAGANIDYDIANQFVSANGAVGGGGVRVTIDPSKVDQAKSEPGKGDQTKGDQTKGDQNKPDPRKPDAGKPDTVKADGTKSANSKLEGRIDSTKADAGTVDGAKIDSPVPHRAPTRP